MTDHPARPQAPTSSMSAEGAAFVLSLALGRDNLPPLDALESLRQRVATLSDPTTPTALQELAQHLPVLDCLWQRLAADALSTKLPDNKARLVRAALQAQAAYGRTLALLHGMELQRRGLGKVTVNHDHDENTGADFRP